MNFTSDQLSLVIQGFTFMSAFAAVVAGFLMFRVTKRFGTGILASGFRTIAVGVFFIALSIILDVFMEYYSFFHDAVWSNLLPLIRGICLLLGTYIIVIGSKKTADKLESLTR